MFTAALFTLAKIRKHSKCPSTHDWLKMWCIWKILGHYDFPGGSDHKESACNAQTQVQSLGWEDPLEKEMVPKMTNSQLILSPLIDGHSDIFQFLAMTLQYIFSYVNSLVCLFLLQNMFLDCQVQDMCNLIFRGEGKSTYHAGSQFELVFPTVEARSFSRWAARDVSCVI